MTATAGRIPVTDVRPAVEGGWPAKAVVGEQLPVTATVFRDGHDKVGATAVLIGPDGAEVMRARMRSVIGLQWSDGWQAEVCPAVVGEHTFVVEGWTDPYLTWADGAAKKIAAGVAVPVELEDGALLLERATKLHRTKAAKGLLADAVKTLRDTTMSDAARAAFALGPEITELMWASPIRELLTPGAAMPLLVERPVALVGAWYELFPRSTGADASTHGTFLTAARALPRVAEMGFDVVYLPPIHPIGLSFRKGPNNTLTAGPDDVGSPWAIGSPAGGHDAIHPQLGSFDDFAVFVATAKDLGLEVALDLALQCSPDHPWVTEHPEWFTQRSDGSIAYAENPPKKYQDIYPINFDRDPEGLREEVLRVVLMWVSHGVRIFRVDNPHTKPVQFWTWLLAKVRDVDPGVVFLSEAFTRAPMMKALAASGYSQSYTYFTWKTLRWELEQYLTELTISPSVDVLRPALWVNTPDILHESLQHGGPPVFKIRAVLAATASPTWGMYSGFELFEGTALREGSEEYLDTEKFQLVHRDYDAPDNLGGYLRRLNEVRRGNLALQRLRGLVFHHADDERVLAYSRRVETPTGPSTVLVVVNLDPHHAVETIVHLDWSALGRVESDTYTVHDMLGSGETYTWSAHAFVRLDPYVEPAHLFVVDTPLDPATPVRAARTKVVKATESVSGGTP